MCMCTYPTTGCVPKDVVRRPQVERVSPGVARDKGEAVTVVAYTTTAAARVVFEGTAKHASGRWHFVPSAYGNPSFSLADSELVSIEVLTDAGFATAAAVVGTSVILGMLATAFVLSRGAIGGN